VNKGQQLKPQTLQRPNLVRFLILAIGDEHLKKRPAFAGLISEF
jgi:hypothetical protein